MADFEIKREDDLPKITATLKDSAGAAVDLTGSSVAFRMATVGGSLKVNAAATILDAASGRVEYAWNTVAGDTDTAGIYRAEFQVTDGSGDVQKFPTSGFISVRVNEDVDG